MASIRRFKKELTYLVDQVISDCYVALYFQPEDKREQIIAVISDAVEFNNGLLDQINHPTAAAKADPKQLKSYYKGLREAMFNGVDKAFDSLGQVCGAPKEPTRPALT